MQFKQKIVENLNLDQFLNRRRNIKITDLVTAEPCLINAKKKNNPIFGDSYISSFEPWVGNIDVQYIAKWNVQACHTLTDHHS